MNKKDLILALLDDGESTTSTPTFKVGGSHLRLEVVNTK